MSDKPRHIRHKDPVDVDAIHEIQERTGQALLSVDQLTRRVLREVNLNRTLVIFMSDNGVMWGEHRLLGKDLPYRWASEVPLFMRWDGTLRRGYHKGVVTNADVGATILDAAGVPNAFPTDGDSVLNGTRKTVVMEGKYSPRHPAFCGSRTKRYLFIEYQNGQRELYDYRSDPLELRNLARSDKYHDIEHHMRDAAKRLCNPPPGSFTWGRN